MSSVPGCVCAEPDGLTYAESRDTPRAVAERLDVVAFDFAEINQPLRRDHHTGRGAR